MTRRERLERKLEKRQEWAQKRQADAAARFERAHQATEHIPMGQPILVGHHSEKRHRAAIARSDSNMRAGCESSDMAAHHESKAEGIERQLDHSIFSDDPDAVESLEAKLAGLQAEQTRDKAVNAAVRKATKKPEGERVAFLAGLLAPIFIDGSPDQINRLAAGYLTPDFCGRLGIPAYVGQNRNGNMGRIRKRIEDLKSRAERSAKAEESAGGVAVEDFGEYVRVTFAEKPDRDIINALKAAGFHWGAGSWSGRKDALPACVTEG